MLVSPLEAWHRVELCFSVFVARERCYVLLVESLAMSFYKFESSKARDAKEVGWQSLWASKVGSPTVGRSRPDRLGMVELLLGTASDELVQKLGQRKS